MEEQGKWEKIERKEVEQYLSLRKKKYKKENVKIRAFISSELYYCKSTKSRGTFAVFRNHLALKSDLHSKSCLITRPLFLPDSWTQLQQDIFSFSRRICFNYYTYLPLWLGFTAISFKILSTKLKLVFFYLAERKNDLVIKRTELGFKTLGLILHFNTGSLYDFRQITYQISHQFLVIKWEEIIILNM